MLLGAPLMSLGNHFNTLYIFMLAVVGYLTFNLLLLIVDLKGALILIDQLHLLADAKQLTMDKFILVRDDINARSESSRWVSDLIIVPCLASVLCIVYMVLVVDRTGNQSNLIFSCGVIFILIKELLFVAVVFWYVAKVNSHADALTVKLSKGFWCPTADRVELSDMHRLSIHASSVSEPISFTLLFRRLSWQNVAVSAAGLTVSILAGVVKNIVGA